MVEIDNFNNLLPCCLKKKGLICFWNKISTNHGINISLLHKNQEFSWKSFPHVFKAIRLLEKKLEPKKTIFVLRKKVFFLRCRISNRKTRKNELFLSIFETSIWYGENQDFEKSCFYHLYLQLHLNFFGENQICL